MTRSKLLHSLGPLLGLLLFSAALWVLYHELQACHFQDIAKHLSELPRSRLFAALGLTCLNYLILTAFDALAMYYIRHPLFYGRIALASFVGYAFSNNMGFGPLAGGSVRYRLYSGWGLSALEITKVIAFCSLTLWLGFFTLAGVLFVFEPMATPEALHLPFATVHPLGAIFLGLTLAYLVWSISRGRPLKIRQWEFHPPSPHILVAQIPVAVVDWILAGSVFYIVLPSAGNLSYSGFFGVFMLAQFAGAVSQIPGGLGVFEAVVLLLLSSRVPASGIFGALLVYRAIYYIMPLGLAVILLGAQEIVQRQGKLRRLARIFSQVSSGVVPIFLTFVTFVAGAILLFSGATPAVESRLQWLRRFLPLPLLEMSHFLGSLCGMALLFVARGLQRRLDAAYVFTVGLLGLGIIFSLLKGLEYEEATVLALILAALLLSRRHFYRKASIFSQRFGASWIAAIIVVLLCSVWLGKFSYKHIEYSRELWWQFTLSGNEPRFLRSMVGAAAVALFFALARLLSAAPPRPGSPSQEDLERIGAIVRRSARTSANLALLGDKLFLFGQKRNAFIMYGITGRSWVALGDPVGPDEEWPDLLWRFSETCDLYDGWPVFYEVAQARLDLYLDLGLTLLKLGEEARVCLESFSLEGGGRKSLRYSKKKLEEEGCTFEVLAPEAVARLMPELKAISDAWLTGKNTREKKFSLGFFNPEYLRRFAVAIVRRDGRIVAFANIWQGSGKEELALDLMRYLPEDHLPMMDYLIIQLMLWGRYQGYCWLNLGMAPLSGVEGQNLRPLWQRFGGIIFRHGEHFYNFQGLRRYKEKFQPEWRPKYLACPGGVALPHIFGGLASLISGGLRGTLSK